MKKNKQKNHRSSEERKEICEQRDSGVPKRVIVKAYNIPRQSLKDLKPKREDKYKDIEQYFVKYIKFYHRALITKIGCREKKQIRMILEQLTDQPDETLQKLILDYQTLWENPDILTRRRRERIIKSLEELPQTEINSMETESNQEDSLLTTCEQIKKKLDHQEDYQSYYPIRKQIKLIVLGQNDIIQTQYHQDPQQQDGLQLEVYDQYDGESEPQFGQQQFQHQTKLNSINLNDIVDQQYHSYQCYQVKTQME